MKPLSKAILLLSGGIAAIGIVAGLFGLSERIIHHHNNFIRRFPHHVAFERSKIDLVYNSYYFAGAQNGKIYLGNWTTPLNVTIIDIESGNREVHKINIDRGAVIMKAPSVKIIGNIFFLYEGLAPYIFKGSISDWRGNLVLKSGKRFTLLEPSNASTLALRYEKNFRGDAVLGMLDLNDISHPQYFEGLLEAQQDAFFDTDGSLAFDQKSHKLVYTYKYRNQFFVTQKNLSLEFEGNTIDTISKAKISLATIGEGRKTFAKPPLVVNKLTAADNWVLFVNSTLAGQFDDDELWKNASIVDVYDIKERTYRASFPIYHVDGNRMKSFLVDGDNLYALIGTKLVWYGLRENYKAILKTERNTDNRR